MTKSNSFWPTTPFQHRMWWEENAPEGIKWGLCWCGCDEPTGVAKSTQRLREWLRYCPKKFLAGHGGAFKPPLSEHGVNKNDGKCECGCGNPAPLAKHTVRQRGTIEGKALRYIHGHHAIRYDYTVQDCGYETPCWIWHNQTGRGYGAIKINGVFMAAHRFIYEKHVGLIPDGYHLHHKCEIKNCVNPAHMKPLSVVDHERLHPNVRLTVGKAREARRLVSACGMSYEQVAQHLEVSRNSIAFAVRGLTWKE